MQRYKDMGLKMTPQRLAIIDFLEGNKDHPSADEIYRSVRKRFPTMSFATVYNTLETLRDKGAVLELTIDPDKKRFDPQTHPHHHLICSECRRIVDIAIDYDLQLPDDITDGFRVTGNHIEFYGICGRCANKGFESEGRSSETH